MPHAHVPLPFLITICSLAGHKPYTWERASATRPHLCSSRQHGELHIDNSLLVCHSEHVSQPMVAASGMQIKGISKKGKEFFKFNTQITETIRKAGSG
jgi:hypothetical protein